MGIHVRNGTPNFSKPSLCVTCRFAQNIQGLRLNDQVTICRVNGTDPFRIAQPVLQCSEYDDQRQVPLWQMEKIAWRFSIDDRKKISGFLTPGAWKLRVDAGKETEEG